MNNPKKSSSELDPLMEGYLEYLLDVGRKAPRTVIDVRCTLKRVSRVMQQLVPDTPLWKVNLVDYLRWIESEREQGRSAASLKKDVSHLRGLLDYAWRGGRSERNVLDGFQLQDSRERQEPQSLSIEEATQLVQCCQASGSIERRDRIVILLLYGCGLRTQELCDLKIQDIDTDRKELKVQAGKGDRQRIVPIPEGVHTELLAYLLERKGKRGFLLRTEAKRRALKSHDVCRVVREAAERARITQIVTPKTLRHSYATHLMERGVDLAVISRLMGHRSPRETGVYLHSLRDRDRQAVDRLGDGNGKSDEQTDNTSQQEQEEDQS